MDLRNLESGWILEFRVRSLESQVRKSKSSKPKKNSLRKDASKHFQLKFHEDFKRDL